MAWWRHAPGAIAPLSLYAAFFLANAGELMYTTRRGKFNEWDRILDRLSLAGNESVLDMGCGRGAVLTAVAQRLSTGRVTGIDIWNTARSIGQRPGRDAAQRVARRRRRSGGDRDRRHARAAVPDASFDLVVSSLAIHNIRATADRRQAVAEGFRVLAARRPDGHRGHPGHGNLRARPAPAPGAAQLQRRRLGWRFWWGNPIAATTLLTASKP